MSSHVTPEYLQEQGLSPAAVARFFSRIRYTDSCWIWTGARRNTGQPYGYLNRGVWVHGSRTILAHKLSWILHFGVVAEDMCVCHDCPGGDCPYCVNPSHLWLGTRSENGEDMWEKGRARPVALEAEEGSTAKFTNEQADLIRSLYRPHIMSQSMLARKFGVTQQCIGHIVRAETYRTTGASNPRPRFPHKLTQEQKEEVRHLWRPRKVLMKYLAKRFGVGVYCVAAAVHNR